jgi:hypothetical protein
VSEEYELLKQTLQSNLKMFELCEESNIQNKEKVILNVLLQLQKVIDMTINYIIENSEENYLA